ncbi:hypothetical protein THAOC_25668 [Thalassiosira oceanica]|uniref:Uncharacterized protein n=1 Tax=Thalassiosira oceanica TaxID=159749 RepID=K0RLX8_THAOC|nr:hypothetical protein THAOC_25668 [Thalassiosira oceanica]|eukprot:EJK54683.1 hypothetical protein THAOC_25668 [Thalassiosira oceanica]
MGLGQGSGWAPAGWTALISTAIICAYKVKEMYTTISAVWFNVIAMLATMMFVDDINQFLRAIEGMSTPKFTDKFIPLNLSVFPRREEREEDEQILNVSIPSPAPNFLVFMQIFMDPAKTIHLKAIYKKGMTWAALSNSAGILTRADRWLSFFFQLRPALTYALEAFCADPKWIEDKQHKIFYACLPKMGINRNILRRTRTLPHAFGGLGMFDLFIEILGRRLHFIWQWWGTDTNVGRVMYAAYEAFMKDHGLAEDVFSKDFEKFSQLT